MRIAELRERAQRSTKNLYDTYFTRKVSIYLTMVCYALGISANAVSGANWFVAIAACSLIGFGTGAALFAGIALVHLHAVLDSVDGELARLRQVFTIKGLFLEDLCAFTMINGMFLAIAGYLYRTTQLWWPLALAVIVCAFGRNAMQVARRTIIASLKKRQGVPAGAPAAVRGVGAFLQDTVLHFTNMWVICTTLVVVEELADLQRLRLVLYAFCFFAIAVLAKELAAIVTFTTTDELARLTAEAQRDARGDDDQR